jgi:low affinity Fe/Cu permease
MAIPARTSRGRERPMRDRFNHVTDRITIALGSLWALVASVLVVVVWALTGPIFNFSDTWQLVINTGTTVVTFWMVFVIQNSQNRDARAVHVKLDEIIRSLENARNEFINTEAASEDQMERREQELNAIGADKTAENTANEAAEGGSG